MKPPSPDQISLLNSGDILGSSIVYRDWWVSTNVIAKQATWDAFSGDPALSIKKACELALSNVKKRLPQVKHFSVKSVELNNLIEGGHSGFTYSFPDKWCYQIEFLPADPSEHLKSKEENQALTQVILFDGTIVTPTVSK